jgi:hypothetical protein
MITGWIIHSPGDVHQHRKSLEISFVAQMPELVLIFLIPRIERNVKLQKRDDERPEFKLATPPIKPRTYP